VKEHLDFAESVFETVPDIDAVFVPGGDPGHTEPAILLSFLEKKASLLRRHHPNAGIWTSPQNFGSEWMAKFFHLLEKKPKWLTGIVYGPNIRVPLTEFREKIPGCYPIRGYADITHTFHCQYPVPEWDAAFALTEGREPINPRPEDQADILNHELPHTDGFITYSEGVNDDINKMIWSALGLNPERPPEDILHDYARYFISPKMSQNLVKGIMGLEQNWRAPLTSNTSVQPTFKHLQSIEKTASEDMLRNWRFQQILYRAYYDAIIHR
jgi:hypothetical protein